MLRYAIKHVGTGRYLADVGAGELGLRDHGDVFTIEPAEKGEGVALRTDDQRYILHALPDVRRVAVGPEGPNMVVYITHHPADAGNQYALHLMDTSTLIGHTLVAAPTGRLGLSTDPTLVATDAAKFEFETDRLHTAAAPELHAATADALPAHTVHGSRISTGALAGAIVGGVLALLLFFWAAWWLFIKKVHPLVNAPAPAPPSLE